MSGKKMAYGFRPAEPLWRRVPSKNQAGRPVSDFMMLIPRLSKAPDLHRERVYAQLQAVLRDYSQQVCFADLNLQLNLLWISVESTPGVISALVADIRRRVPEAVLIGHECGIASPADTGRGAAKALSFKDRILRLCGRRPALSRPDSGLH